MLSRNHLVEKSWVLSFLSSSEWIFVWWWESVMQDVLHLRVRRESTREGIETNLVYRGMPTNDLL